MKKTYIILIIVVLTAGCNYSLFAQFYPRENHPSSQAISLGEYGKVPVNLFTGQPNVSIPLYEVIEGDLSLPITLSYNLADVKPNKNSGWLGIGWVLDVGGCITRNVRGAYDEKIIGDDKIGFYYNAARLKNVNKNNLNDTGKNFTGYDGNDIFELMTDEYSFHVGKYSGRFYLDENKKWVVVSDHDLKVEVDSVMRSQTNLKKIPSGRMTSWGRANGKSVYFDKFKITDPEGIEYYFGGELATEYSISYYNRNNSDLIPSAWFLTKIKSPNGYEINLTYKENVRPTCEIEFAAFSSESYAYGSWYQNLSKNLTGRKKLSGYLIFEVLLHSIETSSVKLKFTNLSTYSTVPEDFLAWNRDENSWNTPFSTETYRPHTQFGILTEYSSANTPKLQKYPVEVYLAMISIEPKYSQDAEPVYLYFNYFFNNGRKKLRKITEQKEKWDPFPVNKSGFGGEEVDPFINIYNCVYGVGAAPFPDPVGYTPKEYKFLYYDEIKFPRRVFAATDHWGYLTTGDNKHVSTEITMTTSIITNREPSILSVSQAETLKSIVYPTGGKTEFKYRQNTYSKVVSDYITSLNTEEKKAGGVCLEEIKNYDENGDLIETKKYYYTDAIPQNENNYKSSGILNGTKRYSMSYRSNDITLTVMSNNGFMTTGPNQTGHHIGYSSVIEQTFDSLGNSKGHILYRFTNYNEDIWGNSHYDEPYEYSNFSYYGPTGTNFYTQLSSRSMERGKLSSEEYYSSAGKLLKSVQYKYKSNKNKELSYIKTPYQEMQILATGEIHVIGYLASMGRIYTDRYLLSNVIETIYDPEINLKVLQTSEKSIGYNQDKLIAADTITNSFGEKIITLYKYPGDFLTDNTYKGMYEKHIKSPIVEKSVYKNSILLDRKTTKYKQENKLFVPEYILSVNSKQNKPDTLVKYLSYDKYGNPFRVRGKDRQDVYYYRDETGQRILAECIMMDNTQKSPMNMLTKANYNYTEEKIRQLRESKDYPHIHVTSFSYRQPWELVSRTDPNGLTVYYQYDVFGNMIETYIIENEEKIILNDYKYKYKFDPLKPEENEESEE